LFAVQAQFNARHLKGTNSIVSLRPLRIQFCGLCVKCIDGQN
jgi:hypothetical protein